MSLGQYAHWARHPRLHWVREILGREYHRGLLILVPVSTIQSDNRSLRMSDIR